MRVLISHAEESYLRSVQLALDAHGIRHVDNIVHVDDSVLKHPNSVMVDDADYERALAVVQSRQRTPALQPTPQSFRRAIVFLVLVVAGVALLVIAAR